jgi:hypothetical protein
MGGLTFKSLAEYEAWFPSTDEEWAFASTNERERAIAHILDEVDTERARAERQQAAVAPMEGGADRTKLPARIYYERITGEAVRDDGKCKCPNFDRHANGDRTPSLWANGGKLHCFSCNMTIRSVQLLAITMGVGFRRQTHTGAYKWELDEDREGKALVMERHAQLFPIGGESPCRN